MFTEIIEVGDHVMTPIGLIHLVRKVDGEEIIGENCEGMLVKLHKQGMVLVDVEYGD